MPLPILERSRHLAQLDIINVSDFKPLLDIWLIQAQLPGPVQHAIDFVAQAVGEAFAAPAPVQKVRAV